MGEFRRCLMASSVRSFVTPAGLCQEHPSKSSLEFKEESFRDRDSRKFPGARSRFDFPPKIFKKTGKNPSKMRVISTPYA
jgi:hypothetical protein